MPFVFGLLVYETFGLRTFLKGVCHENITVFCQFCAEVITYCLLPIHQMLP